MMFWYSLASASSFMPVRGSTFAGEVDALYLFSLVMSVISFIAIVGSMFYFILKYRRRSDHDKTAYIGHNHLLEFLWSFIPLVIMLVIFAWGWHIFHQVKSTPANAVEVFVKAKKWMWQFEHNNGIVQTGELTVPVGKPIKLLLTSEDVIHSFYVPSFRVKQDAVPGMYTTMWFESPEVGEYQVFCAEYCGLSHSGMLAKVNVVPQAQYEAFLAGKVVSQKSPEERGFDLFNTRSCNTCHSTDGTVKVGPSVKGFWSRTHEFVDGSKLTQTDENYVRESILDPAAKVVKGFQPLMPTFKGVLKDDEINDIVAWLKTQK